MITITIDGKTYRQNHNKYNIDWLLEHGYMEELKPLSQKRAEAIERGEEVTILEKLREELERRIKLYKNHLDGNNDTVKGYECAGLLDFLTSLESQEEDKCNHVSDGVVYASFPPKQKCMKCGIYSTEPMPIITEEEPDFTIRDVGDGYVAFDRKEEKETEEAWQPEKGDIIEVSHDNKYWHKKAFKLKDKGCFVCHNDISPNHVDVWLYARPLPQQIREVIVPEFVGRWENKEEGTKGFVGIDMIIPQVEALTKAVQTLQKHPLFNNQK